MAGARSTWRWPIGSRSLVLSVAAMVAIAAAVVFWPALGNGFVSWDDTLYVLENPHIRSIDAGFFLWAFTDAHAAYWAPLTWLSYALEFAAWGERASGYHLTNVLLHAANVFLVTVLAARVLALARERGQAPSPLDRTTVPLGAGVAGILFALHPLRVESVAWIAERKGLLSGLFFLLALVAYLWPRARPASEAPVRPRWDRFVFVAFVLSALALLCKPTAVVLPVVLLIMDGYPLGRIRSLATLRAAVLEKLPFFAASALSVLMSVRAARTAAPMLTLDELPLSTRLLVSARSMVAYAAKMLWPDHLVPFYPYPEDVHLLSARYVVPLALVIGITVVSVWRATRSAWSAAWLSYAVTLLPVIGLVQAGVQSMADRFTYLPSIAPAILVGAGVAWVWRRAAGGPRGAALLRGATAAAVAIVGVILALQTVRQIPVWKDALAFWSSIIEGEPTVYFAYSNRAAIYQARGEPAKAIQDLDRALALNQNDDVPFANRGVLLLQVGEVERGLEDLRRACELGNDFACGAVRWHLGSGSP